MKPSKFFLPVICGLALGSCSGQLDSITASSQADFTDPLGDSNAITRPPNVIAEGDDVLLQINDAGVSRLLPELSQARIARAGSLRWLEVNVGVDEAWEVVRKFWNDQGFDLEFELPEAGFMETSWQQDRSRVVGTGISRYLDVAFGVINDTGVRHKFRVRIERGSTPTTSNIFVSHRVIEQGGIGTDGAFTRLPSDPILEVEMMRRLMIAFRLPEESIATLEELTEEVIADNDLYTLTGNTLTIARPFAQAWRLVGVALDRSGFTVDSSNLTARTYTLLIADVTDTSQKQDFFVNLFQRKQSDGELRQLDLELNEVDANTVAVVAPATAEGETIIRILAQNL